MNSKPQSVTLLDLVGRFIADVSLANEGNQYSGSIDLGDQASGVYILLIQQGERTHQIKLIRK